MEKLRGTLTSLSLPVLFSLGMIFTFASCDTTDTAAPDTAIQERSPSGDPIAQTAMNSGLDSLVAALLYVDSTENAGLVDLFTNTKDQYTVFAPTNAAFANLVGPGGAISDLDSELVLNVLYYHVTEGRRKSNSVVPPNADREIETLLAGQTFSVGSDEVITANNSSAGFEAVDISCSNGVVHVIDTVLLP
jgi:uncharacterized surface protein with fasciclin (FAS1) repeats